MTNQPTQEFVIQIDARDKEAFLDSARGLGVDAGNPEVAAGLDGISIAEFVLGGVSSVAKSIAKLIKAWTSKRKYMRVVYDGTVYEGYTIHELAPLLEKLSTQDGSD